jgi:hypothetical protein
MSFFKRLLHRVTKRFGRLRRHRLPLTPPATGRSIPNAEACNYLFGDAVSLYGEEIDRFSEEVFDEELVFLNDLRKQLADNSAC